MGKNGEKFAVAVFLVLIAPHADGQPGKTGVTTAPGGSMLTTTTDNPITKAVKYSEIGTPEMHKQAEKEGGIEQKINPHTGQAVARVRVQRPIDYYHNRGYIEDYQFQAAQELDRDYHVSGTSVALRSSLNLEMGDKGRLSEYQMDAKKRYDGCMAKLDRQERGLIRAVIFDDGYLKDLKGEWKAWGMLTPLTVYPLCRALDKIAKFYGLIN